MLVWPQWWSFADVSQQGLDFSKKISKTNILFWFAFHRCWHGSSKFPMSKIIRISLILFSLKNIGLEEGFFGYCNFLKTSIFEPVCFLKWCPIFEGLFKHLWKSNHFFFFILLIFLLKSTPCWFTSTKLHHWGHTIVCSSSNRNVV